MAPTVQPSPQEQNNAKELTSTVSLADTIHDIRDLIFKVAFPKTNKANNATIDVE